MKNIILFMATIILLVGCGGNDHCVQHWERGDIVQLRLSGDSSPRMRVGSVMSSCRIYLRWLDHHGALQEGFFDENEIQKIKKEEEAEWTEKNY